MKTWILAVLAAMMLVLAGCASQQQGAVGQQASGGANNVGTGQQAQKTVGTVVKTSTGKVAPEPEVTCAIVLSPQKIYARESTDISYKVYSSGNTKFTYNCGDEIRSISSGGLITGSRICQFNSPGNQAVWIKADGELCAVKNLEVVETSLAPRRCWINESSIIVRPADFYYSATVYYEGFAENDTLTWVCDRTTATTKLGSGAFGGTGKMRDIYCDYSAKPEKDIKVTIGEISCGSISTQ